MQADIDNARMEPTWVTLHACPCPFPCPPGTHWNNLLWFDEVLKTASSASVTLISYHHQNKRSP